MIKHVFGPVASRRLGISLGVDIIPYKTCSFDCIYCECGKTTHISIERKRFVDPEKILNEIKDTVNPGSHSHIDYITFSGAGEPTLNSDIGHIITSIKSFTSIPVAVLTNGSLLYLKEVREDISNADLVLPSLDAATPDTFSIINRPHPELQIQNVIDGLITFGNEFKGQIWLEVFIAQNVNDNPHELEKLHETIRKIRADKVRLNSLDRPPAYDNVKAVDLQTLESIKENWNDLPVEIIKRIRQRNEILKFSLNLEHNILNTINRRPLTIDDLETLTGKNRSEIFQYIDILEKEKKITPQIVEDKIFYTPYSRT